MIYPPNSVPGGRGTKSVPSNRAPMGCSKKGGSQGAGRSGAGGVRGKGKQQQKAQLVQWKQRNVQEGIVVVDEQQLSKLIKRIPIQDYYDLDPEPFATGLFASVRRCRSRETGQLFAAKFASRTRYGEDCSAEIHHEIALLSLCSPSPRIIRLHDVFETQTEIIIVLEFAPGGDLQTIIDDNLVPFEADVVKFVRQLVEGLAYLHERKIAHLDIKPQNLVMMADFPDCDVKLCDFEISRVILEGTEIREILGTPDYVAPEILHYEPITLAADMWSLGVTTYVLLTGFSPFGGETDQETFCNISRAEVDFPEELFEDVSPEAQDFIARLLVRDPSARPTAKECLHHEWLSKKLTRATNSTPTVSPTPAQPPSRSTPQQNLRKYLSKSREALFERVVMHHNKNSSSSNLRKTTLLSQYHKTRRLCESQMSLVSKSRERLHDQHQLMMSPSFSRSREKLYGLRSLSKSHEVLDLCRGVTSGNQSTNGDGLGGILRTLTRATTADLSMIPQLLRARLAGHDSSTASISSTTSSNGGADMDVAYSAPSSFPKTIPSPLYTSSSTPNSPAAVRSPMTNSTIHEMFKNAKELPAPPPPPPPPPPLPSLSPEPPPTPTPSTPQLTPIPALLSPKLLKETIDVFSKKFEEATISKHGNSLLEDGETPTSSSTETLTGAKSPDIFPEEAKLDDTKASVTNKNSTVAATESGIESASTNSSKHQEQTAEEKPNVNENDQEKETSENEEEPRYTVAQLISAFNKHQEVVTKSSLEVTMTTSDKLPPQCSKFPTGPNALRLFIPDIDIGSPKPRRRKKPNTGLRFPNSSGGQSATAEAEAIKAKAASEETTPSTDPPQEEDEESQFQSLDSNNSDKMSPEVQMDIDSKSPTCCSLVIDSSSKSTTAVREDSCEEKTRGGERLEVPHYLRSGSVSSEASSSSSLSSWEELAPNKEDTVSQKAVPMQSPRSRSPNVQQSSEPWSRICTGSYTRAIEKFNSKTGNTAPPSASKQPTRKSSLSLLTSPEITTGEQKVRRKSSPAIKQLL